MTAPDALVIGAGPAGLMAAQMMAQAGLRVVVADQMPSPARKFLMAGKSGLNLTKDAPIEAFLQAYEAPDRLLEAVRDFGPDAAQDWAKSLGQELFTGSTGRVFPKVMKASPLLRAWLAHLADLGVTLRMRHRWTGWQGASAVFETPDGTQTFGAKVTVLACGGGSWARLGSDGAWMAWTQDVAPFAASNAGLRIGWGTQMAKHYGQALKAIALRAGGDESRGECVITQSGLEGGGIYTLSRALRDGAPLQIDLMPDVTVDQIRARLARPRGKASQSNHLRKTLGLGPAKIALLNEFARPLPQDLAPVIKGLQVAYDGLAPIDQAISTAGGLRFEALDGWMIRARPGVFCAGEMLDWDAPTGGYLLTACLASGRAAGLAAVDYIRA